jgi:hypothetical protein
LVGSLHFGRTIDGSWRFAAYCGHVKQTLKSLALECLFGTGRFRLPVPENPGGEGGRRQP